MNFTNEAEVLQVLNIPTWGALTPELVLSLANLVPAMDKNLAVSILPKLSSDALQEYFSIFKAALGSNDRNQDRLHEADQATLDALTSAYSRAETPEERREHWARIEEVREQKQVKDTENKEFWVKTATLTLVAAAGVLTATFLAARVRADQA